MNTQQNSKEPNGAAPLDATVRLLPCPFCGKTESLMLVKTGYPGELRVVCNYNKGGCGGSTGAGDSEKEAADKWNRRAYRKANGNRPTKT